jgi:hypothetical protein
MPIPHGAARSAVIQDRILRDSHRFFREGLQYRHLTRRLYEHLTRRCGFVVRRKRRGFYESYIEDPDGLLRFLDQFDRRAGCPSAEMGAAMSNGRDWLEGEHADLNSAMVGIVRGMIPAFRDYAHRKLAEMRRPDPRPRGVPVVVRGYRRAG